MKPYSNDLRFKVLLKKAAARTREALVEAMGEALYLCPNNVLSIFVVRVVCNDRGLVAADLSREVDGRI